MDTERTPLADLDLDELREIVAWADILPLSDRTAFEVVVSRVLPLLLSELTELRASLAAATARNERTQAACQPVLDFLNALDVRERQTGIREPDSLPVMPIPSKGAHITVTLGSLRAVRAALVPEEQRVSLPGARGEAQ